MADAAKRLPGDVSHLQRLIGKHAADRGMPPARLQRWLNAMIVTAVLERVRRSGRISRTMIPTFLA
jgi:hypothetical protein